MRRVVSRRPVLADPVSLVLIPGLAASFLLLSSAPVAHQDLGSYIALRSGADQTWRRHVAASVPQSMRMASFALARPLPREDLPSAFTLARHSPADGQPSDPRRQNAPPVGLLPPLVPGGSGLRALDYPAVNRTAKGDLLVERPKAHASLGPALMAPPDGTSGFSTFMRRPWEEPIGPSLAQHPREPDPREPAAALSEGDPAEADSETGLETSRFASTLPEDRAGIAIAGDGVIARAGAGLGAPPIPVDQMPFRVSTTHEPVPGFDPILGALSTDRRGDRPDPALARLMEAPLPLSLRAQRTGRVPPSGHPALSLSLAGRALERAERCLAEAVYWEARGEPELGQVAVAQVVVNRAVSGFYPRDICGVVYQNAHRYLACQFTFACEGRASLVPTEREPWLLAQRISRDMLAGRSWLTDVGHATHYHANYVSPWWARSMRRLQVIGVHIFYRPRNWGTGES